MNYHHIPVLLHQVLQLLEVKPGKVFVDCTLGLGGHTEAIAQSLYGKGAIYGIEGDERNLAEAKKRLNEYSNIHFIHSNFKLLEEIGAMILKREKRIDGILFDLGLSSVHVEEADRGFSFQQEGPLDMRFDTNQKLTASEIVHTYPFEKLFFIFKTYGEEKFSRRIAQEIVTHRRKTKFTTTTQLADFVAAVVPHKYYRRIHPATRVFQALRIATNRELEVLEKGLSAATHVLSPNGRLLVISYHSLEDRITKHFLRNQAKQGILKILTKKPINPDLDEMIANPRSRSAKLRAAEKLQQFDPLTTKGEGYAKKSFLDS